MNVAWGEFLRYLKQSTHSFSNFSSEFSSIITNQCLAHTKKQNDRIKAVDTVTASLDAKGSAYIYLLKISTAVKMYFEPLLEIGSGP